MTVVVRSKMNRFTTNLATNTLLRSATNQGITNLSTVLRLILPRSLELVSRPNLIAHPLTLRTALSVLTLFPQKYTNSSC